MQEAQSRLIFASSKDTKVKRLNEVKEVKEVIGLQALEVKDYSIYKVKRLRKDKNYDYEHDDGYVCDDHRK